MKSQKRRLQLNSHQIDKSISLSSEIISIREMSIFLLCISQKAHDAVNKVNIKSFIKMINFIIYKNIRAFFIVH
jgi:hypothetical protein